MNAAGKRLLAIVELGGYPDFSALYRRLGFEVEMVTSMRKALAALKKRPPDVIVAEFNFQPDFRDRYSNLETLMAVLQGRENIAMVVFYEAEQQAPFLRTLERFPRLRALTYPVTEPALEALLSEL